jgi:hypothetical protein
MELSTYNGNITITNAAAGAFTVLMPYSKMSVLPPNTYYQSLIQISPSGTRTPVWSGTLVHSAGPTQQKLQ